MRDIETELTQRFPDVETPRRAQICRWLSDPDAVATVRQEETRLRATYTQGAADVVPAMFELLAESLVGGETGKVRDLSQALSAVTRGIVRDQLEITPGKVIDTPDELAAILARNGVLLTSEHKSVLSDAKPKGPSESTPSDVTQRADDST